MSNKKVTDASGEYVGIGSVVKIVSGRHAGESGTIMSITFWGLVRVRTGSGLRLVAPVHTVLQR